MKETLFQEKIYLGKYMGEKVWLDMPSWDCGWYWGFGYIGNRNLHTHYESVCLCELEKYNSEKKAFIKGKFAYILTDNEGFSEVPFDEKTLWKLSDYMKSFYTLKESAEVLGRGSSHYTEVQKIVLDKDMCTKINEVLLPNLFNEIYKLLKNAVK